MTPTRDRTEQLLHSTVLNGIDFVEITSSDQMTLRVHFLNAVDVSGKITNPTITGGEVVRTVTANPINDATDWSVDSEGRNVLTLTTQSPGDFSFYTLLLESPLLDRFFSKVQFSFKARCPSDLDCEPLPHVCPPIDGDPPPIDYLARDFLSFRRALLDFSSLRYPEWQERSEADIGVMFLEALSSLADDLSYTQDRTAANSSLDTCTDRRSATRLARLVDYEPRPATSSRVTLQLDVLSGPVPAGLLVKAAAPDGTEIPFETGTGLLDTIMYTVSPQWNRGIQPYWWDDSQRCLAAGSTEMWVAGQGFTFTAGQALLIDTAALTSADPPIREIIHITAADEELDPLFPGPPSPATSVTHLVWSFAEALKFDHDLTRTVLAGNLVPATQGRRYNDAFAIDVTGPGVSGPPLAAVRTGANGTPQYLYTLRRGPVAYLVQDGPDNSPKPEIQVVENPPAGLPDTWNWQPNLLKAPRLENDFTLDPARYIPIASNSDGSVQWEYDGDAGSTIRFGDSTFGPIPQRGSIFQVKSRDSRGADGNVSPDSIRAVDPAAAAFISAVINPFAAEGGADAEPLLQIRRNAPQAFRAIQYRAVLARDYEAAALTLPWVERAGTVFRWTGSWLTVFTTPDPEGSEQIAFEQETELINLLNRYRLAGYESYVPAPQYVGLDLKITVCARSWAFRGDVEAAVLNALRSSKGGFFYIDKFTFGTPLELSALEAAVQESYGVAGVISVQYRRRGLIVNFIDMPETVTVGANQLLRVDNDPSRPERGSLRIYVEGGK